VGYGLAWCPYSQEARRILLSAKHQNNAFFFLDQVFSSRDESDLAVDILKRFYKFPTVPLIFHRGRFLGGKSELEDFLASSQPSQHQ